MPADETRRRLMEAASQVFAERGFDGATVREICDRAAVNVSAVKYYFGDKQALYCEVIKAAHEAGRVPRPAWGPDTPPEEKLRDFVRQLLGSMIEPGVEGALEEGVAGGAMSHHRQLILHEMARPTRATAELARDVIAHQYAQLLAIVGELAELSEERRQMVAFSIVGQCLHYKVAMPVVEHLVDERSRAGFTVDRLCEHITGLTLAALGRAPAIGEAPLAPPPQAVVGTGGSSDE